MKYVKLCEVADLLSGFAFKSKNYVETGIRIIRIANVQDGFITDEHPCFYPDKTIDDISKYLLNDGDLLVSLTGNVGRIGILKKEFLPAALNQRVCCIRIKRGIQLEIKYLYYYLLRKQFVRDCIKASKGVAQLNLSTRWLENYPIPFPDLDTQNEIIIKIEESMSQLDSAVATMKKTKQQLEIYRQAVLGQAFRGHYSYVPIKEISTAISGYAFKSKLYSDSGQYRVIKIGNVKPYHFDFSRDHTRTNEFDEKIKEKYLLKKGDCVITLTGSRGKRDYGFVSIVKDEKDFLLNQRVAALRFDKNVALPEFYLYYLSSPDYRNRFFSYETGNVGQGNVGIKALTEVEVVLPSLVQQKQIVQNIEAQLSECSNIEQTVNQSLQQAEALRQSILKQAFPT